MKNLRLAIFVALTLIGTLCAGSPSVFAVDNGEMIFMDQGSFLLRWCASGYPCDTNASVLTPGDGSPQPLCAPGKNCNNGQFQLRAGDGSPQPLCAPGKNCNNGQFQLRAGDGSPQPLCAPGKNCNNGQFQLRVVL